MKLGSHWYRNPSRDFFASLARAGIWLSFDKSFVFFVYVICDFDRFLHQIRALK